MSNHFKKYITLYIIALLSVLYLTGCGNDADVASKNISTNADNFSIYRKIVFYDSIQGTSPLTIEGYCSIKKDNADKQLEVLCKTDHGTFLKHFLGISDNVTYFVEQLNPASVSQKNYRVIFKPSVLIPDMEMR